jgi:hypothetical protein
MDGMWHGGCGVCPFAVMEINMATVWWLIAVGDFNFI